ncbi:hypothetical protein MGWOODY_Smn3552 [hydrothermal vent metagenome]|uniref:Uncharacterized protein n=1 Tax=hydrothermal vent metagenome TaxID=652676 RepID=A0A160TG60_9ZZZZ
MGGEAHCEASPARALLLPSRLREGLGVGSRPAKSAASAIVSSTPSIFDVRSLFQKRRTR